ncbi:MAG: hypothetical protein B6242_00625 [Anaerolineaceae bacterium 4572_78]|nr:MAG: hypothetical protein B6242_00625 [Anaerolineaceae bacterium 4572_78]
MIPDYIKMYHDLLTDDVAINSQIRLDEQQHRRGLFFGDRALCTVLRPRFLTTSQYEFIQYSTRMLLKAFHKIHHVAMQNAEFRKQFKLLDWEERLMHYHPGYTPPAPISRLDTFYIPERNSMKITEYNAETPAAPAYNDVISDVFFSMPIMRRFMRYYNVYALPARHGVLQVLLDCYQEWDGGNFRKPRIAILDWENVPTYSEFVLFERYFHEQGLECVIADPNKVDYHRGKLYYGKFKIDLIFKRVLISELIERQGWQSPVVQAVLDNAVCMVNHFVCKLMYKKCSLAVLSDERNAYLFNHYEHQVIDAHVPWTRTVEERKTTYHNLPVDLIPFIAANRDKLVLKPNDDYGGRGIVLGWTVDITEWERSIRHALVNPYIVQERIPIPQEPYPSLIDGKLEIFDRWVDTNPFIFYGDTVYGCLTRLATTELLNVTAGGGSTASTFLVERR